MDDAPRGIARGFEALEFDPETIEHISTVYRPEAACGARSADRELGIEWPKTSERILSDRDRALPFYAELRAQR